MDRSAWGVAVLSFISGALSMFILSQALGVSVTPRLAAFESRNVKNAKARISDSLFDPYSAKFEEVREIQTEAGAMVCGVVNAKNKMGGYVGRKPFYYVALSGNVGVIRNNSDAFVYSSFAKYCFPGRRFPKNSSDDAGWGTD
ncbi:hypothetical protein ABIE89_007534 [Bradyrhizobium niftali]|uniref:hypothetical protein n=1 Tax=Bradyrhizobium niftali TaxID=2560055 RepID=UPI0038326E6A